LATMMIPGEMMVISNYVTVSRLKWTNDPGWGSYYAMIFPFLVSIFHIYLLRQTFRQIPNELYYAAKVDGCTDFKYLWRVMVPMAKSSIITITILKIMGAWNAYIWPDIVANEKYKLVTTWLRSSFVDSETGVGRVLMNYQMGATVIVTVPLLLFFIIFRKYIMSGVSRSGVKG
ncbi:MAG: carbohydrate ABC transporter permease, partial [Acholeplasmataceae bacterium]